MSAILTSIPYFSALSVSAYLLLSYICMIALPLLMLVLFALALLKNRKLRLSAAAREKSFTETLGRLDLEEDNAIESLQAMKAEIEDEDFSDLLDSLSVQSEKLYRGKWLPDPQPLMLQQDIFQIYKNAGFNGLITALLIVLGILAAVVVVVAKANLQPAAAEAQALPLPPLIAAVMIPLGTALITAALLTVDARNTRFSLGQTVQKVSSSLSEIAPVYQDRAGVTLLISELISYGENMREEVKSFSDIANQLVQGEFAEGVRNAVREVMETEIAPPIQKSAAALTELADSLAEKQATGMQELADSFTHKTVEALQLHLAPLPQELSKVNRLTDSALSMMEDSKQIMATSRDENIKLNQELHEILGLMAISRNDIANEAAALSDNLRLISDSSDKLTALYMGEQEGLANQLSRLSDQLRLNTDLLNRAISDTSKTIEKSVQLSEEQGRLTESFLQRVKQQVTALEEMTRSIEKTSTDFTQKSSAYVQSTLQDYDSGLAEVIERLSFTTAEIREAIDSLPAAIRSIGKD
ncbi:MAG: hypothetical protein GX681_04120 [Clostridiaceae bacterium]|nr:hypothetical protein [Clostridiaceae bacterium]